MMKRLIYSAMVFAAMTFGAYAADPVKVCTGSAGGVYDYVGQQLKKQLAGQADIEVVNTAGSWDNLKRIQSGECGAAVIQSDALYLWSKSESPLSYVDVGPLYTEYAHLLCNRKSTVTEWSDLTEKTKIFSGGKGSGADVTARGLIEADNEFGGKEYAKVPLLNEVNPLVALVKVKGQSADCLFYVGGKGNKFMTVDAQKLAADLVIVPVVDKDFNDVEITDQNGNTSSVWNQVEMPYDTYTKLMPSGVFGRSDVETVGTTARLIVSENLVTQNPDGYAAIGFSIGDVMNIVRADKGVELVE